MTPLLSPSRFSSCSFPRWHLVRNKVSVVPFGEKEATDSLPALGFPGEIWQGTVDLGEHHTDTYPESEWTALEHSKLLDALNTFGRLSEGSLKTELWLFYLDTPFAFVCHPVWDQKQREKQPLLQTQSLLHPRSWDVNLELCG